MAFTVTGLDKAIRNIQAIEYRIQHLEPVLNEFGKMGVESIHKNFTVGGRPKRWKLTEDGKKPLTKSSKLKNSIKYRVKSSKVTIFSKVKYAATHNYGRTIRTKNGTYYIPKRRFMMLQKKDIKTMKKKLPKYIVEGKV